MSEEKYQEISRKTAELIANQLRTKPDSCLGLPTGRTPLACYAFLSGWTQSRQLNWSKARSFALDDYLDAEEHQTFAHYLQTNLYKNTNQQSDQQFNPRFFDDYDGVIAKCGGLDLTVIGIGSNGHIAFNEPGTARQTYTHCVKLTESTRQANSSFFGSIDKVPIYAVTMGVATILSSRLLVLIASGERKKKILDEALNGPVTPENPASYLQEHKNLTVLTDW